MQTERSNEASTGSSQAPDGNREACPRAICSAIPEPAPSNPREPLNRPRNSIPPNARRIPNSPSPGMRIPFQNPARRLCTKSDRHARNRARCSIQRLDGVESHVGKSSGRHPTCQNSVATTNPVPIVRNLEWAHHALKLREEGRRRALW